jgi:hypothetical protein
MPGGKPPYDIVLHRDGLHFVLHNWPAPVIAWREKSATAGRFFYGEQLQMTGQQKLSRL